MGFCIGSVATIKELVTCERNYSICKISIFRNVKDKQDYKSEMVFFGFARFLGEAHKKKPSTGERILIKKCDVTNVYTQNGTLKFNKNPVFIIYDYDFQDKERVGARTYTPPPMPQGEEIDFNSDGLPF